MQLVSRASTIKIQEERKVRLTDPDLFETPFLFMNGHNDFVLTEPELANLRKYLSHGGFFFCFGLLHQPGFPQGLAAGVQPDLSQREGEADSLRPPDLPLVLQDRPQSAACTSRATSSSKAYSTRATWWP